MVQWSDNLNIEITSENIVYALYDLVSYAFHVPFICSYPLVTRQEGMCED